MSDLMFVLPVGGGSGGAHSVMQEVDAMRRLGADVTVACNAGNLESLRRTYRDLPTLAGQIFGYEKAEGLGKLIRDRAPGVVVATTNQSVHVVAAALRAAKLPTQRTAYYIQDYEPLFYAKDSDDWLTAHTSYTAVPDMLHFSKTGWLQETVRNNHAVEVHKVAPSVDHDVYYPRFRASGDAGRFAVVAMLRPSTPRRAPRRTVRILNRLVHEFGDRISCTAFGCTDESLKAHSLELSGVENAGVLPRSAVGTLFRETDLFLDLSDYQAFGRTAVEAMSCGAIPVVPVHGGAGEFAEDGINGFVVDTRDDDAILAAVAAFLGMTTIERDEMRANGIATGFRYSPEAAAISELRLLLGPSGRA